MSVFDFYAVNQEKGFPGMKANVTDDTCDSFASEGGVDPGEAVIRGTNPDVQAKAVSVAGDGAKVIGIAVHAHKDPNENGKYYADGDSFSVMTHGDIYVEVGGDVTAGGAVALAISDGKGVFVATGTGDDAPETVAGMIFMESGSEGDIVRVRIRM